MSRAPFVLLVRLVLVVVAGCAAACSTMQGGAGAGRTASVDGIRVRYDDVPREGSVAPPPGRRTIVFVHGWSCDRTTFRAQAELASDARLLFVDLPGHGQSDKPEIEYTLDLFARAVAAVMDDAGVESAVIAGHSNGAAVAARFYRLFPARVEGLIVIDGSLQRFDVPDETVARIAESFAGDEGQENAAAYFDDVFAPQLASQFSPEDAAWLRDVFLATPPHVRASSFAGAMDRAAWSDAPMDVPLLNVLARSPFWDDAYEARVRAQFPYVDYREIDGASHFLMLDHAAQFDAAVREFLDYLESCPCERRVTTSRRS